MQRFTYGHIPVKGHGYEQHHLGSPGCMNEKDLKYTGPERDGHVLSEKVINHLGGRGGAKQQLSDGKLASRKYMGNFKWGSSVTVSTTRRFPVRLATYSTQEKRKSRDAHKLGNPITQTQTTESGWVGSIQQPCAT